MRVVRVLSLRSLFDHYCGVSVVCGIVTRVSRAFFFFNDTATTEIYTRSLVGSVRMCIRDRVYGVDINPYAVAIARFRLVIALLDAVGIKRLERCLLYTSPSPRDRTRSRMPSSA